MQEFDHELYDHPLPPIPPRRSSTTIIFIALAGLLLVIAAANVFSMGHAPEPPALSLENRHMVAQLTAAQAASPDALEPQDRWVESRDGDGSLDVEDVNGTGTI